MLNIRKVKAFTRRPDVRLFASVLAVVSALFAYSYLTK
jgi:hypothetical protein